MNSDKFAVNYSTGILYTTQTIDREEDNEYWLTVLVTDGGVGATAKVSYFMVLEKLWKHSM